MLKSRVFSLLVTLATVLGLAGQALGDEIVNGSTGPGSVYRLVRPSNWNGILVVYAHGYCLERRSGRDHAGLRTCDSDARRRSGFAVAVSSFSENGYVIKDGTQRTHQLLGSFTSKFGRPSPRLRRRWHRWAGSSPSASSKVGQRIRGRASCVRDGRRTRALNSTTVLNVRVLFDLFYPGVLPGTAVDVPPGLDANQDIVAPRDRGA